MPQEFAVMLDDKKLADMRRREMQHMINRFYHQKRIVNNFKYFFQVCLQLPLRCRVGEGDQVSRS